MKRSARKPSATSRIVGYRYEGTILDLPRVEAILRRAEGNSVVTQYVAKQYGARDEGVDCVWFNGPPGAPLRKVRDAVRALMVVRARGDGLATEAP
jgi:hypothetical protein